MCLWIVLRRGKALLGTHRKCPYRVPVLPLSMKPLMVSTIQAKPKMTDDARTELELYQKGVNDSGACPIVNCARHSVAKVALKPKTGHLASWRGCPKFPKPRQQPHRDASRTVSHSAKPFRSKKITEGISFASVVKGVPPQQSPSMATTAGNQYDSSIPNINSNDKDSVGKILYIINEFVSIFNSLGRIENVYNSLRKLYF
ncbi:hypothetical protein CDAR_5891 [Caerostris darwini]|uniref:Uncharacterized protein n=1 Tax=Caerostris darwini TaxID=1538125 RepID=A0AAV4MM59_9ARAC|nr:hypothetical protein CDAR_5891 [Caerostris darwini]